MGRPAKPKLLCCLCRRRMEVANGRCNPCRLYRWRTGYDRPIELIENESCQDRLRDVIRITPEDVGAFRVKGGFSD